MNAVGAAALRNLDQPCRGEIALGRVGRPNEMRFVGKTHVQRAGIRLRIDRDGAHAEALGRASDARGDLAAVRDQNRCKHWPSVPNPKFATTLQQAPTRTWEWKDIRKFMILVPLLNPKFATHPAAMLGERRVRGTRLWRCLQPIADRAREQWFRPVAKSAPAAPPGANLPW